MGISVIYDIVSKFSIEAGDFESRLIENGHINDTFLISDAGGMRRNYILQKINGKVFRDVPALMDNIDRVTRHMRKKVAEIPGSDPERECLTLIPAKNGQKYYMDERGDCWRMYIYINGCHSCDVVTSEKLAYEGGKAFGRFQASLSDLPGGPLFETIPDFHNIEKRLNGFYDVLRQDPQNRAAMAVREVSFVEKRACGMKRLYELIGQGRIPVRITHNDTKFNNVLLDENEKALCVIDLDTVMNGCVHYDFGDSIRTVANTGAEDERDLDKVSMNLSYFRAFSEGFLSELSGRLVPDEIENLAFSCSLMTFTIGLRFLTDFIDGDNYFRIHYPEQNLIRTRAQFRLIESMEEQYDEMQLTIETIADKFR